MPITYTVVYQAEGPTPEAEKQLSTGAPEYFQVHVVTDYRQTNTFFPPAVLSDASLGVRMGAFQPR